MAISEYTTSLPSGAEASLPANATSAVIFDSRHLTVGYGHGSASNAPPMPAVHLQGRWLDAAGFAVGSKVRVQVAPRRLIIEAIEEIPERGLRLPRRAGTAELAS